MIFFTAWATVIVITTTCYYISTTCPPISRGQLLRSGVTHQFYPGPMRDHVLKEQPFATFHVVHMYYVPHSVCLKMHVSPLTSAWTTSSVSLTPLCILKTRPHCRNLVAVSILTNRSIPKVTAHFNQINLL